MMQKVKSSPNEVIIENNNGCFCKEMQKKSFFLSIEQTSGKMFPLEMAIFHSIEITKLFKQGQYRIRIRAEQKSKYKNRNEKKK